MSRKFFVVLLVLAATIAAAVAPVAIPARAQGGEIKVGFISAFTGVFSSFGKMQKEGAVLALEEANYLRVGHKSEHIKDWFNRTQRTSIDEIKQDNEIPRI